MFETKPPEIDWLALRPVILVAVTGVLALVIEMFRPKKPNEPIVAVSLIGLATAILAVIQTMTEGFFTTFGGMVFFDGFGSSMQLLILIGAFLSIVFSEGYLREKRIAFGEFYPLALWATAGAMIMATTQNLLMLFIGLEVLSISLYVMAGMSRSETKSEESAMKYFLLGSFATGFFLYGIALIYGGTGTLHLPDVFFALQAGAAGAKALIYFGFTFILIGLGFKAAFVPFHQWTPDVYQGAPTNVTAFMAAASKIAAFAALWRVLQSAGPLQEFWLPVLSWLAVLTMVVGNLIACVQTDIKRILAYSSIAHAGYVLVAVVAHFKDPQQVSATPTIYYLLVYTLATVGAFAVVSLVARNGTERTRLEDLSGLKTRSPFAAWSLVVFTLSLIGVPILPGFFGKLMIFESAIQAQESWLAIVLAATSAISVYYYIAIMRAALVDEGLPSASEPMRPRPGVVTTCVLCLVGFAAVVLFQQHVLPIIGINL